MFGTATMNSNAYLNEAGFVICIIRIHEKLFPTDELSRIVEAKANKFNKILSDN